MAFGTKNFKELIRESWQVNEAGVAMFRVIAKLKRLKGVLSRFNRECFHEIQRAAEIAKLNMEEIQGKFQEDPLNEMLIEQEKEVRGRFIFCQKAYNLFLLQKAKVEWMRNRDDNTALFHACLRARRNQNKVNAIRDTQGVRVDNEDAVKEAFLNYYKELLGKDMGQRRRVSLQIMKQGSNINTQQGRMLQMPYLES